MPRNEAQEDARYIAILERARTDELLQEHYRKDVGYQEEYDPRSKPKPPAPYKIPEPVSVAPRAVVGSSRVTSSVWGPNVTPEQDKAIGKILLFILLFTFVVIILGVALSGDDTPPNDSHDTPYQPPSNIVYVSVNNQAASGYVSIYVDGAFKRKVYISHGDSWIGDYTSTSSVTFQAIHEDGFVDSASASPGNWAYLYLG